MNKENKDAAEGWFFLITLFLSLGGLLEIMEGSYFTALLFCTPPICWMSYVALNHKSLKGDEKTMAMASFFLLHSCLPLLESWR